MEDRRKILFIAEAVTLAHVTRPLVLARSLDPSRYEVHFACADRFPFVFEDETFTRWSIESIEAKRFFSALNRGSPLFDYRTLAGYAEEEAALLERLQPDLVVGDFRLSLAVSATLAGVPYASINNAHWSPYTYGGYPLPDLPMVPFLGVTLSNWLFQTVQPLAFAYHARPLNRLRREKGLVPLPDVAHVYTHADHTLYADVPGLIPTCNLPANHHYIGPLLWSPSASCPDWWEEVPLDRPWVYVTLGSSGRVKLLSRLFEELEQFPVCVVVATAGRAQPEAVPDNVWVADFLPGEEASARAALVICSGGSGTAYQALAAGAPVLGLSMNMDQYLTMRYISEAGAGIGLRSGRVSDRAIRSSVETLLNRQSYREAAGKIAEEFRCYSAVERFGKLMDEWLA